MDNTTFSVISNLVAYRKYELLPLGYLYRIIINLHTSLFLKEDTSSKLDKYHKNEQNDSDVFKGGKYIRF